MKFFSLLFLPAACLCFSGCNTSSGVVPLGGDSYMISRTRKSYGGSASPVKASALKDAGEFCAKQGRVLQVTKTVQKDMKPFRSDAAAEVYFKALHPGDPELNRKVVVEELRE